MCATTDAHAYADSQLTVLGSGLPPLDTAAARCMRPRRRTLSSALLLLTDPSLLDTCAQNSKHDKYHVLGIRMRCFSRLLTAGSTTAGHHRAGRCPHTDHAKL
jgi:hypothetical protein